MLVNGMVPRSRETHAIHGLMIQGAIREAEEETHTDEFIDYNSWKPTPMHEVTELCLSFKREEPVCG